MSQSSVCCWDDGSFCFRPCCVSFWESDSEKCPWWECRTTEWNNDLIAGCVSPGRPVSSFQHRSKSSRAVGHREWSQWRMMMVKASGYKTSSQLPTNTPQLNSLPLIIICQRQMCCMDGWTDVVRRMNSSVGRFGLSCGPCGAWRRLWAVFK